LSGILAAFQFLTLLPVKRNFDAGQLGRSSVYFPLVGLTIGLILTAFYFVFRAFPDSVANILLLVLLVVLSGGIHLDGLADTMDGIAGHRTAEQRLAIMRDSRIGGFGAIGLVLLLLVQYVALNSLAGVPEALIVATLILSPVASRWAMVYAIYAFPYARPAGLGRVYKDAVTWRHFAIATVFVLAVSVALLGPYGLAIVAGVWVVTSLAAFYLKHQLGGLTGDTYGAINELAIAVSFLLVTLLAHNQWLDYGWWIFF
jgi:adenosylcobinamide-GDP ribazoletransferase